MEPTQTPQNPVSVTALSNAASNTPAILNVPQTLTAGQLVNGYNLTNPSSSTDGNPKIQSFSLTDLINNLPVIQAQSHPGYTGTIGSSYAYGSQGQVGLGNAPKGYDPNVNYNGFIGGQCTSYASWYWSNILGKKFTDTQPGQGNAKNWPALAKQQGYNVSTTPTPGSIVVWPDMGAYGHVAIVQGVNPDGTINVSEMNYRPGQYDTRSNVSSQGAQFIQ